MSAHPLSLKLLFGGAAAGMCTYACTYVYTPVAGTPTFYYIIILKSLIAKTAAYTYTRVFGCRKIPKNIIIPPRTELILAAEKRRDAEKINNTEESKPSSAKRTTAGAGSDRNL